MLQQTRSPKRWDTRRQEKQTRIGRLGLNGKVLPTDDLPAILEKLIAPGEKVVLEGRFSFPHAGTGQSRQIARSAHDHAEREPAGTS